MTGRGLAGLLETTAERHPTRTALVDEHGETLTYEGLNRWATAVGHTLAAAGVRPGDRVGLAVPKSIPAVAAIFGILKVGAAYVPIDVSAPAIRSRRILEDCQVSAVVADCRQLDVLPQSPPLNAVIVTGGPADAVSIGARVYWMADVVKGDGGEAAPAAQIDGSLLAYILYTSGSTGAPKGVMISHDAVLAFLDWCSETFQPTECDRFSSIPPFHFDPSVLDLFLSVKHGAELHLMSPALVKAPDEVSRFIATHRLTVWTSTPSILMLMLRFADLTARDASSLRLVLFGGEVFPVKALRQLRAAWPAPEFYNLYGPTETTVTCTSATIPSPIPLEREQPYPIGFPCSHVHAVVLGADGREVPEGQEGVLHVRGTSTFTGYWGRAAETQAAMVEYGVHTWYCTGDVVRFDAADGFSYVGRRDRMVKRRGYRIELDEIERTLLSHADVREAAVAAPLHPDGAVRIIAHLVCEPGRRPSTVELKAYCARTLPAYMSPDQFRIEDELPRTSTDKIDYRALSSDVAVASRSRG